MKPTFNCPLIRVSGVVYAKLLKYEKLLFVLFLGIVLLQLWLTRYVPSLDGPQHLYNANVLANLINGNELVDSFFTLNDTIVGYWTAHGLLAFFTFFLPSWLAEKLFLSTYVLGMVFSFRYLVRSIQSGKGNFVSYLIFPFIYHSFLLMGYYAFSFGAIFFFLGFGFYIRNVQKFDWKPMIIFSLLLIILFLTHGLIYIFFLVSLGIYVFIVALGDQLHLKSGMKKSERLHGVTIDPTHGAERSVRAWLMESLKLIVAALPSLVLWFIYIQKVVSLDSTVSGATHTFRELVAYLIRLRQLVGFHHQMESPAYIPLFVLIFILFLAFILLFSGRIRDKSSSLKELFTFRNAWIFPALLFLGLYFLAPDRISAGSLTHRFGLYFFFLGIAWLSMQKFPKTLQVITVVVLLFSISYSRIIQVHFYRDLNKDIEDLTELTQYMEPNTIVDYRLSSPNWIHLHFPLYAALDRPLVHLRNVQCWGQFPMVWNYDKMPRTFAGNRPVRPSGSVPVSEEHPQEQIDYFTIFYEKEFWKDSTEIEWQHILIEEYEQLHISQRGRAGLYKKLSENGTESAPSPSK